MLSIIRCKLKKSSLESNWIRKTRKLNLFTPSHHDLKKFVRETSPYVSCRFTIDFDHPSYRQGIISKVKDEYIADLLAVVPVFKMLGRRENYRGLAISCLSEIGFIIPNKVIPILKQMLETDWMRDQDASNALCELGKAMPNKVLPVLNVLAKSENWNVSGDAQRALCNIGVTLPDKVIPIFLQWVDDKNNSALRFQGISCLEKIMPVRFDAILQYFRKWAEDDDCNVRKAVALSLRNVVRDKPDQILSILESLSTDKEWLVRSAAEVSFGKYHQKLP
ncbi:DNA alkylation repair protein [candidate division KSB1 bacterium]|nr:DNA alkylation repair protein [candidate division KSB1 bacterium]